MTSPLPFTMSKHAIDRALEMGVTGEEIRAAYDRPAEIIWSSRYKAFCYVRGRVTLAVTEDRTCVGVGTRMARRLRTRRNHDRPRTTQQQRHATPAKEMKMSDQQYRVIADRGSMAEESWIAEGDRVTYGAVSSTGELVIVRIERLVPAA